MTNQQVFDHYKAAKQALEGLETSALEPTNPVEVAVYAGILTARVGEFVQLCLTAIADQLTKADLEISR